MAYTSIIFLYEFLGNSNPNFKGGGEAYTGKGLHFQYLHFYSMKQNIYFLFAVHNLRLQEQHQAQSIKLGTYFEKKTNYSGCEQRTSDQYGKVSYPYSTTTLACRTRPTEFKSIKFLITKVNSFLRSLLRQFSYNLPDQSSLHDAMYQLH